MVPALRHRLPGRRRDARTALPLHHCAVLQRGRTAQRPCIHAPRRTFLANFCLFPLSFSQLPSGSFPISHPLTHPPPISSVVHSVQRGRMWRLGRRQAVPWTSLPRANSVPRVARRTASRSAHRPAPTTSGAPRSRGAPATTRTSLRPTPTPLPRAPSSSGTPSPCPPPAGLPWTFFTCFPSYSSSCYPISRFPIPPSQNTTETNNGTVRGDVCGVGAVGARGGEHAAVRRGGRRGRRAARAVRPARGRARPAAHTNGRRVGPRRRPARAHAPRVLRARPRRRPLGPAPPRRAPHRAPPHRRCARPQHRLGPCTAPHARRRPRWWRCCWQQWQCGCLLPVQPRLRRRGVLGCTHA